MNRLLPRPLLSPAQCRAARALLGWTQETLADKAGIARRTVAHFEVGRRALLVRTRREIAETFERAGVEFVWSMPTAGEGVRLMRTRPLATAPQMPALRNAAD